MINKKVLVLALILGLIPVALVPISTFSWQWTGSDVLKWVSLSISMLLSLICGGIGSAYSKANKSNILVLLAQGLGYSMLLIAALVAVGWFQPAQGN